MLTNDYPYVDRSHSLGGTQRLYEFPGKWGLSCVNSPKMHNFPFAWEIAVMHYGSLVYDTPLTDDVVVFQHEEDANAFIHRAAEWFEHKEGA